MRARLAALLAALLLPSPAQQPGATPVQPKPPAAIATDVVAPLPANPQEAPKPPSPPPNPLLGPTIQTSQGGPPGQPPTPPPPVEPVVLTPLRFIPDLPSDPIAWVNGSPIPASMR